MTAPRSGAAQACPLAGTTVLVTRPAGTGASMLRRARALGAHAIALPGLRLLPAEDAAAAAAALRAARTRDVLVFASPAAVRFTFALLPRFAPGRNACVLALGQGTCRALARHGIAAHAPPRGTDSEALLALPALARVRDRRIALVGAPGGRGVLAATLRRRGADVLDVHVYQRAPPRLTRRHLAALAAAPPPWITLVSSGEALAHLLAALPASLAGRLRQQALVTSSERLADMARTRGFQRVTLAASALPSDLFAAATRMRTRRR